MSLISVGLRLCCLFELDNGAIGGHHFLSVDAKDGS